MSNNLEIFCKSISGIARTGKDIYSAIAKSIEAGGKLQ